MSVVQLASLKKYLFLSNFEEFHRHEILTVHSFPLHLPFLSRQFVLENIIIKAQRKRMKEIEKDVATLKKEERGLGVKKAKARKIKLELHLERMTNLVMEETRAREQAQRDVATLTEEVTAFSQQYERICHDVEALLSVKHR